MKLYLELSEGYILGLLNLDRPQGIISLLRTLKGTAATRLRGINFKSLAKEEDIDKAVGPGCNFYMKTLEAKFPESKLRLPPRKYRALFSEVRWHNDVESLQLGRGHDHQRRFAWLLDVGHGQAA